MAYTNWSRVRFLSDIKALYRVGNHHVGTESSLRSVSEMPISSRFISGGLRSRLRRNGFALGRWSGSVATTPPKMRYDPRILGFRKKADEFGKEIKIMVDGKEVTAHKNQTILQVLQERKTYIPTLCYHPMLTNHAQCRLCLVEAKKNGWQRLVPSCTTKVEEGMEYMTHTPDVEKTVKFNLSMLRCRHPDACITCEANGNCEFQKLCFHYEVEDILPQKIPRSTRNVDRSSPSIVRDMNKCVLCSRCIRACSEVQGMNILGMVNRGGNEIVGTFGDLPIDQTRCINCGQCSAVCPVGAITENLHIHKVQRLLDYKDDKILVAHTAPAVRVAISEEFGMDPGTVTTGKLVTALRKLGFDYVFDTQTTADLTIIEEATEFLRRVKEGGPFPMFTSCCPAWINLVEKSYPHLMKHLSTCKSPQGMMGTLIKRALPERIGVSADRIVNVSIMPCVAKKDEMTRSQLISTVKNTDGEEGVVRDTDYVLTTRELGRLIHEVGIHYGSLEESDYDPYLGISTGAGAMFAATGGVLEAALRTAYWMYTKTELPNVEMVRPEGLAGIRTKEITLGSAPDAPTISVAVAHGTANVRQMLDEIDAGESKHHLIEVMACPGGCIGGGGEPKPGLNADTIFKRVQAVYGVDRSKAKRRSHENEVVKHVYTDIIKDEPGTERAEKILHTHYRDRRHEVQGFTDERFDETTPRTTTEIPK